MRPRKEKKIAKIHIKVGEVSTQSFPKITVSKLETITRKKKLIELTWNLP